MAVTIELTNVKTPIVPGTTGAYRIKTTDSSGTTIDEDPSVSADTDASIISYLRHGDSPDEVILAVFNFTPVPRIGYRIGVPADGGWRELLNSDADCYGGSGHGNFGGVQAETTPCHGRDYSINLTLPPLGLLILKPGIAIV